MFDRVIAPTKAKGWRTFLIVATAGGHGLVLVALVLVAFWKIEPLQVNDNREIVLRVATALPPAGGPPPGEKLKVKREAVPKVKPLVPVQPTQVIEKPLVDETPGGSQTGSTPGGGGDNPDGDPDSELTGTGQCAVEPCGVDKPEPVVTKPRVEAPKPPAIVPPNVAAGLRIAGNDRIYPPDSVRVAMMHGGQDKLQGTLKLCVDATGAIDSVKLLKSTGHAAYDSELISEMRGWRYRPYQVNGVATAMCTVEVFIYRMTR